MILSRDASSAEAMLYNTARRGDKMKCLFCNKVISTFKDNKGNILAVNLPFSKGAHIVCLANNFLEREHQEFLEREHQE